MSISRKTKQGRQRRIRGEDRGSRARINQSKDIALTADHPSATAKSDINGGSSSVISNNNYGEPYDCGVPPTTGNDRGRVNSQANSVDDTLMDGLDGEVERFQSHPGRKDSSSSSNAGGTEHQPALDSQGEHIKIDETKSRVSKTADCLEVDASAAGMSMDDSMLDVQGEKAYYSEAEDLCSRKSGPSSVWVEFSPDGEFYARRGIFSFLELPVELRYKVRALDVTRQQPMLTEWILCLDLRLHILR